MTSFETPAFEYMSTPILGVSTEMKVLEADWLLEQHRVSALGVMDPSGGLVGVISRTDLLSASSAEAGEAFRLPRANVTELMTRDPIVLPHDASLRRVAKTMLDERIHRVFLEKEGTPVGILSTRDMMRAVRDKQVKRPAIEIATKGVIRVDVGDTLSLGISRLDVSNKHGLIVVEDGWPVGTFAQRDALAARARNPRTSIDEVMSQKVLALPPEIPLYRAAGQALDLGVRRIVLVDEAIRGVVSTYDFARVAR